MGKGKATKSEASNTQEATVVSVSASWYKRKTVVLVAACLLLIALAAVVFSKISEEPANNNASENSGEVDRSKLGYQDTFTYDLSAAEASVRGFDKVTDPQIKKGYAPRFQKLGMAYDNVEKRPEAIDAYKKAIELDPSLKIDTLGALSLAYYANNQKDLAIQSCQELITILKQQPKEDIGSQTALAAYEAQLQYFKTGGEN